MAELTIAQTLERKQILEGRLFDLIRAFEEETGVTVDVVLVGHIYPMGERNRTTNVVTEVKL